MCAQKHAYIYMYIYVHTYVYLSLFLSLYFSLSLYLSRALSFYLYTYLKLGPFVLEFDLIDNICVPKPFPVSVTEMQLVEREERESEGACGAKIIRGVHVRESGPTLARGHTQTADWPQKI